MNTQSNTPPNNISEKGWTMLCDIATDASNKRVELIQKYKAQGQGNIVVNLKHGAKYIYGETVPQPYIQLPGKIGMQQQIDDWDLWKLTDTL